MFEFETHEIRLFEALVGRVCNPSMLDPYPDWTGYKPVLHRDDPTNHV